MRLEKMQKSSTSSSLNTATAIPNKCADCDIANNTYNVNEAVEQLVRVADQAATAISDTFTNGVNLSPCRPAMGGLHSVNSVKVCCETPLIQMEEGFCSVVWKYSHNNLGLVAAQNVLLRRYLSHL